MQFIVIGAGAVGGYFGGKLAKNGESVTFLVRENRFRQLSERGLRVNSIHGDFTVEPTMVQSASEVDYADVVIVGLKNYHLTAALPELDRFVAQGAKILPLLNGVQHIDLLVERYGKNSVLGGLCYIESTLNENGDVVHTSPMQDITFGAIGEIDPDWLANLEATLTDAGIATTQSDAILVDMWKKFIFLTSMSGITAATRQPIGVTLNDEVTNQFLLDVIREVTTVGQSRLPELPDDTFQATVDRLHKISPSMTSSLHRDLEKGLALEIDSLHGSVLEMAKTSDIQVPCVRSIYALLHPYRAGAIQVL